MPEPESNSRGPYAEPAIRTKIARGEKLEGRVWIKGPDGRILVDVEGYEVWATGGFRGPPPTDKKDEGARPLSPTDLPGIS